VGITQSLTRKTLDSPAPAAAPTSLQDLKPRTHLTGKVTRLELFGAFVDVGLGHEGLVHISMLKREPVNRVEDVLQLGQTVEVWVHRVDPVGNRLELTMIQPLAYEWRELKPGVRARGRVVKIEPFGAFVDIGAERPGLVHVSEMSADYVSRPEDVVHVGDEIDVAVLDVDRKKRQIKLSMKAAAAPVQVEEPEVEEPLATAMELALRKALQSEEPAPPPRPSPAPSRPRAAGRHQQEDILSRTLKQKVRTASDDR
jgi:ribosomal protein S1